MRHTARCWWCKRFIKARTRVPKRRPVGCRKCKDRDPWDTRYWRFVKEVAAQADALPDWKKCELKIVEPMENR